MKEPEGFNIYRTEQYKCRVCFGVTTEVIFVEETTSNKSKKLISHSICEDCKREFIIQGSLIGKAECF